MGRTETRNRFDRILLCETPPLVLVEVIHQRSSNVHASFVAFEDTFSDVIARPIGCVVDKPLARVAPSTRPGIRRCNFEVKVCITIAMNREPHKRTKG